MTSRIRLATALAGTAVAAAGAASPAQAGEVTLWGCHGPNGQALGVPPFVASATGDGVVSSFGSGCASPVTSLAEGGLRAAFTRPDPQGASAASWRVDVPQGLAVSKVTLNRRTAGFGGTPVPGGGQSYVAETSAGILESASVQDASDQPLDGLVTVAQAGQTYVRFGVRCTLTGVERCAAPSGTPLAAEVGAVGVTVTDAAAPRGAVGGIASPAVGTMTLSVRASDVGIGLASARATVDGVLAASADLGGATCADLSPADAVVDLPLDGACPTLATDVPMAIDTTKLGDGPHTLQVVVVDAAGNAATIADEPFTIRNTKAGTQSSATITVGNGGTDPAAGAGGGNTGGTGGGTGTGTGGGTGGGTANGPVCVRPQLSMFLAEKPLRTVRGVPVLLRGKRYRFGGSLTCIVNAKRVPAGPGQVVSIRNTIGKLTMLKSGITTSGTSTLTTILAYASSRVVEFRATAPDGRFSRVRIKVTVVRSAAKGKA